MISIVTPTTPARRQYLLQLAQNLHDTTFEGEWEWVILEEFLPGEPQRGPWAIGPNARYIKTCQEQPLTVGAKRNLVNAHALGDIIVQADDDDWVHPDRLNHQLDFHRKSGKPVTGYHDMLYWNVCTGLGFKYSDPTFRPNAGGTSLVYDRIWWEGHNFRADINAGEDFMFCVGARHEGKMASQDSNGMVVARVHSANTCHPKFGSAKFPAHTDFPVEFLRTLPDSK